jgi:hypothetical protein
MPGSSLDAPPVLSVLEAERQVAAAAERHREVLASMAPSSRSESAQLTSVKAVGRALALVSLVLKRADEAGVPLERLAELTAWEPDLVQQALKRLPEPALVARVAPGLDPAAVAHAAASFAAGERLKGLLDDVRADIDDDAWSPAAADLDELRDGLDSAWQDWQQGLGRS